MAPVPKPSLLDKALVVPKSLRALFAALLRLGWWPFVGRARQNQLLKDFAYAVLRGQLGSISPAQEQWQIGTTEKVYLEVMKKMKMKPETDALDSGLKMHWFGDKKAEKVILYFHGGGYVLPATPAHIEWLSTLQKDLSKSHSVSIVLPSYTLAPASQYPGQLKQAAESLQWVLSSVKKQPSSIFVMGDSAGGNLTLGLLSHLLHPHTEIANKIHINITEPLAGAVLISPWVKFPADDESVKRNQYTDMLTPSAAQRWSSQFLGSAPLDNYNQPILADLTWFNGLDLRVKDILVWGGGKELLIDSIEAMGKKLKEVLPKTKLVVDPERGHEDFILERLIGYTQKAEGTKVIEGWLGDRM